MAKRRETKANARQATTARPVRGDERRRAQSGAGTAGPDDPIPNDTLEWIATQPHLLDDYVGEWVAFDGRTIVAHDPSFLVVMRRVEELGVERPLLYPVAPADFFIG